MKGKRYSIRVRLMLIIAASILPLNLIVILFAGVLMHNYQQKIRENCQRNIDNYCQELDEFQQALDYDVGVMVSEKSKELEEMEQYHYCNRGNFHFIDQMEEIRNRYMLAEMAYIIYGDGMATVLSEPAETEEVKRKAVWNYLEEDGRDGMETGTALVCAGQETYVLFQYREENIRFGFLMPVSSVFQEMERYAVGGTDRFRVTEAGQEGRDGKGGIAFRRVFFQEQYQLEWYVDAKEWERPLFYMKFLLGGLVLATLVVFPIAWRALRREIVKPLSEIRRAMGEIQQDHYEYRMNETYRIQEFWEIHRAFNKMAGEIVHLRIERYEQELEKRDIEATNLRLQVNPHFLLNSLNMIYSFSRSKNLTAIKQFTGYLAEYFRYALWNTDRFVPLKKEMECVESYFQIQRIRFPGKFYSIYQMEEDLGEERIPTFLVMNFVENAIKYGLDMNRTIEIIVSIHADSEMLFLTITDTGAGMDGERLEQINAGRILEDDRGRHIGIWNCRRRIHMLYGEKARLSITSKLQQGTQVSVELPRKDRRGE